MASRFTLKTKDTGPPLVSILEDKNGFLNLTGCSVKFLMRLDGVEGAPTIEITAELIGPTRGEVRVKWTAKNTEVAGTYRFEYKITYPSGEVDSCPNEGYELLNILETA